jgi:hypothetical protein
MKKYYMSETEEEVKYGDIVEFEFDDNSEGFELHHTVECKLTEESADFLEELGIITSEDKDLIDFSEDEEFCPCYYGVTLEKIEEEIEELRKKMDALIKDAKKSKGKKVEVK